MNTDPIVDIFDKMGSQLYDETNAHFTPVTDNLHFINRLILKGLPTNADVLCVGVGTGADIIALAEHYPNWNFTGIEPAKSMLDGCQKKIASKNLIDRCQFFHGYLHEYKTDKKYDAVICLLVMHFIKDLDQRGRMFADMSRLLKNKGLLVAAEISGDTDSIEFANLLETWQAMHALTGSPPEKLAGMAETLKSQLAILPAKQTESLIHVNGFEQPTPFFQSLLIRAWFARKAPP